MNFSSFLQPSAVRVMAGSASKKRLFHDIGEIANAVYGLQSVMIVDALLERETLGPTGVGHGVALPHARTHATAKVSGVFIRLEKPMDFEAVDRIPVDLIFALIAPAGAGVDHLKALALVSRTLRDEAVRSTLRQNTDPSAIYAVLTGPSVI
ncbi:MAG: PTS sugar transporter subunit IIA [Paracoccaceae bacterium]